jgi:aryl-alcohol dehydrogenase-like predicted oxidoreductase
VPLTATSLELLGKKPVDLIQVHNLTDWETQLTTLNERKKQGRIGYSGITASRMIRSRDTTPMPFVYGLQLSCETNTRTLSEHCRISQ